MTPWPTKKLEKYKKDAAYFLMRDILSCFPDNVGNNLVGALNQHLISKEATRQILKEEIQNGKPQFRILAGALILQNNFLRQFSRAAFYEVIDIVQELKYCFYKDSRKIVKRLSAQVILRLFLTLYFEFLILPLRKKKGKAYINRFREFFSKEDMLKIINTEGVYPRFIFEQHGVDLGIGHEIQKRIENTLNKFYS